LPKEEEDQVRLQSIRQACENLRPYLSKPLDESDIQQPQIDQFLELHNRNFPESAAIMNQLSNEDLFCVWEHPDISHMI
jgi:hypothetical protein